MLYKVQKNCIYMNISITTEDSEVGSQHCTLSIYDSVVGQASSKSDTIAIKLAAQIVLEKIEKDDEYLDSGCEFDSGCCCSIIIDYADNFAQLSKHLNQPLINVKEISKITNFLQPGALPILTPTTYVVPEFYKKSSIGASIFRSVLLLPLILTRLDSQIPKEMGSMVKSIFVDAKFDSQVPQTLFDLWIESVLSEHVAPLMLPMIKLTEAWIPRRTTVKRISNKILEELSAMSAASKVQILVAEGAKQKKFPDVITIAGVGE
nr:7448_t:CDS:2 [Entrophospora candida]